MGAELAPTNFSIKGGIYEPVCKSRTGASQNIIRAAQQKSRPRGTSQVKETEENKS